MPPSVLDPEGALQRLSRDKSLFIIWSENYDGCANAIEFLKALSVSVTSLCGIVRCSVIWYCVKAFQFLLIILY